jgi:prepilin-type N-terminal cleavage/methylation domain-containing protein
MLKPKLSNKKGFTLAELLTVVVIFSIIALTLVILWSTSYRYMSTSYKGDRIKGNMLIALRRIQADLDQATRVDYPNTGTPQGSVLAGATNIDRDGCYPINPTEGNGNTFYYCFSTPEENPTYKQNEMKLYRYEYDPGTGPGCPLADGVTGWEDTSYPALSVSECGDSGTNATAELIVSGLTDAYFSIDQIANTVKVYMRSYKPAIENSRPVDTFVETDLRANTDIE